MTNNQILYQRNLEDRRSHLVSERQRDTELRETGRHNLAQESETGRHNVVTEREAGRHNLAQERETGRHNVAQEGLQREQNAIANAHYNRADTTAASQLAESIRHNVKQEALETASQRLQSDIVNRQLRSQEQIADARNSTQLKAAAISQTGSLTRTLVDALSSAAKHFGSGLAESIRNAAPLSPINITNNVSYPGDMGSANDRSYNDRSLGDAGRSGGFGLDVSPRPDDAAGQRGKSVKPGVTSQPQYQITRTKSATTTSSGSRFASSLSAKSSGTQVKKTFKKS